MKIQEAWERLRSIQEKLHVIQSKNIATITQIIQHIHFIEIENTTDLTGVLYYRDGKTSQHYTNRQAHYLITGTQKGVAYAVREYQKKANEEEGGYIFKTLTMNGYVKFLSDLAFDNIIYAKELEQFVMVGKNIFIPIDNATFEKYYPHTKKVYIDDFLEVLTEIMKTYEPFKHRYIIHQYGIGGKNWRYDIKELMMYDNKTKPSELFYRYVDIEKKQLQIQKAIDYVAFVARDKKTLHNLRLAHAYAVLVNVKLISPTKFFVLRDKGRTGKGLFIETFKAFYDTGFKRVNFDALVSKQSFERSNAIFNLIGAHFLYANETGAIDSEKMRFIRPVATGETLMGRGIGANMIDVKIDAPFFLDTNENVNTGELKANKSRMVRIALKDRPDNETDTQQKAIFKPWWDFIAPHGVPSLSASVSFFIASLEYYKFQNRQMEFEDVGLANYLDASELSNTQEILLIGIDKFGYMLLNDSLIRRAIIEDYGNARNKLFKSDVQAIGVKHNHSMRVGETKDVVKVYMVNNKELFKQTLELFDDETKEAILEQIINFENDDESG
ncbi:hypothetical protein JXA27_03995 [Aerococcaceae bacterium zg-B36]|uniref:hypothetical protein n=1 Tax=Aerococcaceae bacterium zg-252 TaxID=2796928 RepID=UPI001BD87666|nr:hypothetical protein [Aerococcaceae bacterium zg-B36]